MLRRRIEKLEVALPSSPGRLLARLDRRAINSLSSHDRDLVNEMLRTSSRRKTWPTDYRTAEARYLDNFGILLQEISDDDLSNLIAQFERELGHPIPETETFG